MEPVYGTETESASGDLAGEEHPNLSEKVRAPVAFDGEILACYWGKASQRLARIINHAEFLQYHHGHRGSLDSEGHKFVPASPIGAEQPVP